MENKNTIDSSIIRNISVRTGTHRYENNEEVIELTFKGFNCNYIQVIGRQTARDLLTQLKDILPPAYVEV